MYSHLQQLKRLQASLSSDGGTSRVRSSHNSPIRDCKRVPRAIRAHVRSTRSSCRRLDRSNTPLLDLLNMSKIFLALGSKASDFLAVNDGFLSGAVDYTGEDCTAVASIHY